MRFFSYNIKHIKEEARDDRQAICMIQRATAKKTLYVQYIPRNMHTVFALLCFVVVIHWLIFPYPSGLLHWHCGNLTIAPVPAKQPWWIWINPSCEFIMNDYITTTKQSTTKPCAYFLGYTVYMTDPPTSQQRCQMNAVVNAFRPTNVHLMCHNKSISHFRINVALPIRR